MTMENMEERNELMLYTSEEIRSRIVTFRGIPVLMDADIALLYNVKTIVLNQAVKRNEKRFPERYRFQLTEEEKKQLITNCDRFANLKHSSYLPFAFTEQGVTQLSAILRSDVAVEMSIRINDAFHAMRHFLVANAGIFQRLDSVERSLIEYKADTDNKIEQILQRMDEQEPPMLPEQLFATGCVWDAYAYVCDLVRSAKGRIVLIDNFVDDRVLKILDKRSAGVSATVHTRYTEQFELDLAKHNEQCAPIERVQLPMHIHDRFLIVDSDVYLLGASVKDMGKGLCAITKVGFTAEQVLGLVK